MFLLLSMDIERTQVKFSAIAFEQDVQAIERHCSEYLWHDALVNSFVNELETQLFDLGQKAKDCCTDAD